MLGFKSAILAIFQFCQNVKLEGALSFGIHNCKKTVWLEWDEKIQIKEKKPSDYRWTE